MPHDHARDALMRGARAHREYRASEEASVMPEAVAPTPSSWLIGPAAAYDQRTPIALERKAAQRAWLLVTPRGSEASPPLCVHDPEGSCTQSRSNHEREASMRAMHLTRCKPTPRYWLPQLIAPRASSESSVWQPDPAAVLRSWWLLEREEACARARCQRDGRGICSPSRLPADHGRRIGFIGPPAGWSGWSWW